MHTKLAYQIIAEAHQLAYQIIAEPYLHCARSFTYQNWFNDFYNSFPVAYILFSGDLLRGIPFVYTFTAP